MNLFASYRAGSLGIIPELLDQINPQSLIYPPIKPDWDGLRYYLLAAITFALKP